jgi:hypothetical protein
MLGEARTRFPMRKRDIPKGKFAVAGYREGTMQGASGLTKQIVYRIKDD